MIENAPSIEVFGRKYCAFIFDLDGTIVDNMHAHSEAWRRLFAAHGLQFSQDDFRNKLSGRTTQEIISTVFDIQDDASLVSSLEAEKDSIYRSIYESRVSPRPGFVELIEVLIREGVKFAIATSSNSASRGFVLANLGVDLKGAPVVGAESVSSHKPSPETYIRACEALNLAPSKCLAFEDTSIGVNSARSAGVDVIMVGEAKSETPKVIFSIASFNEILAELDV